MCNVRNAVIQTNQSSLYVTHVRTNLIPVLVCKHFSITPPPSISSIPSSAPATLCNMICDEAWERGDFLIQNGTDTKHTLLVLIFSPGFLFPGNLTGLASAAIACNEWNVEPIRNQSLVLILGADGPKGRWRMRPLQNINYDWDDEIVQ